MTASVLISVRVDASSERAFRIFTEEFGDWWVTDPLFAITPRGDGRIVLEGGPDGRLVTALPNGHTHVIGMITAWDPPRRLALDWKHGTFAPEMRTEVVVTFEAVGEQTRVTVVHSGWTRIPREHLSRHGFPDEVTQRKAGAWWDRSLQALRRRVSAAV